LLVTFITEVESIEILENKMKGIYYVTY